MGTVCEKCTCFGDPHKRKVTTIETGPERSFITQPFSNDIRQSEVNCKAAKITKLWHYRVLRRSAIPWPLSPSSFCPQYVSQDYDRMVLTLLTSRFSHIIFSFTHRSGEVPGISCKTYSDGVPWHQLHCSTFQVEAPMLHHKQSPSQVTHGYWGELAPMRWCEEHVSCRVLLPCPATQPI